MKKLFVVIFSILAVLSVAGKNVKNIVLESGGTLYKHLSSAELSNLDSIHVSGYMLNEKDLNLLAGMCEKGKLTGIDLSEIPVLFDSIPERLFMSRSINGIASARSVSDPYRVNLRYIRLPKYVRKIGDMAFSGTNLVEIEIPRTVDFIGSQAFSDCDELHQVAVHSVSPAMLKADGAFDGGMKTAVLSVPVGCSAAFSACAAWSPFGNIVEREGLYTTLHVRLDGKSLDELYGDALLQADSISVTGQLAESDFATLRRAVNYGRLTGIDLSGCTIEGNVLPDCAFGYKGYAPERKNYKSLLYVSLPDGLVSIGKEAFSEAANLRCIVIPKTVKSIGKRAFYNCRRLGGSVTIPEGVVELPDSVFFETRKVKEIYVPSTLERMGDLCFMMSTYKWDLASVRVNRKTPPVMMDGRGYTAFAQDEDFRVDVKNCTLYVPVGSKAAYEASVLWNSFLNIVETSELDGGTSGIAATTASANKYKDSRIYTLDGRYAGSDINSLGKGVYVLNGKKFVK